MARVERFYRSKGFLDAHARVARVEQVSERPRARRDRRRRGTADAQPRRRVVGLEGLPKDVADAVARGGATAVARATRFDEKTFKDAEDAVKTALTDRGYAYAKVDSQAELDIGTHTADYGFSRRPGPAGRLRPDHLLRARSGRRRSPQAGDPRGAAPARDRHPGRGRRTRPRSSTSATQALLDLEVFSAVEIVPTLPDPPPADHVVPLTVKVEPTRLRQITLGGGVEIDEIKTDSTSSAGGRITTSSAACATST